MARRALHVLRVNLCKSVEATVEEQRSQRPRKSRRHHEPVAATVEPPEAVTLVDVPPHDADAASALAHFLQTHFLAYVDYIAYCLTRKAASSSSSSSLSSTRSVRV
jgi:hypothetical protein